MLHDSICNQSNIYTCHLYKCIVEYCNTAKKGYFGILIKVVAQIACTVICYDTLKSIYSFMMT